jgi:cytidylate kinase
MVASQRKMGASGGVVMEGRDIGTKVFPDAEVKIFLDAAPEIRGTRRFMEKPDAAKQQAAVVADLHERDQRDRSRANSPLEPARDAMLIDSTDLSLEQVLAKAVKLIDAKLKKTART